MRLANCRLPIADCRLARPTEVPGSGIVWVSPSPYDQKPIGNRQLAILGIRQSAIANPLPSVFHFRRTLVSLRAEDDEHLVAFHPGPSLYLTHILQIAFQLLENPR